jgi:phosphoenolpyruvate carboxykinase (ATP)
MPIAATRTMLRAALAGHLDDVPMRRDPVFGFEVPETVPGVDAGLLDPRSTWSDGEAYDRKARELAGMFVANFAERFPDADEAVRAAAPAAS